ncbi:hypothetical protein [Thiohalobacter sp. COW1]|nr:hypothetical protein [Thiohalobacter sp. COW1]
MTWTSEEYLDEAGRFPFGRWFSSLSGQAAARLAHQRWREYKHRKSVKR